MDLLPKDYKKKPPDIVEGLEKIGRTKGFGIPDLKKQAPAFFSSKKIMVVAWLILLGVVALWAIFFFYGKNIRQEMVDLKNEIAALEAERDQEVINKIASFERGIESLKEIISGHIYAHKIFELLEQNTLPQVAWEDFSLDTGEGKISLAGRAQSYSYIAKQIVAFEDSPLNQVSLSSMDLSQEGGIEFGVEIGFDTEILK